MIRFSTVAANADVIGEDTPMAQPRRGPGDPSHGAAEPGSVRRERDGTPESGDAKPGQDINAPGFIKERDDGKP